MAQQQLGASASLGRYARHLAALLLAAAAGFGALLAMVHVVACAFFAAIPADLGAQRTSGPCMVAATGHKGHSQVADLGAVRVKPDASHQGFHVRLLQAARRAVIAGDRARMAGRDAVLVFLIFFVGHGFLPDA
jgi:hypothetical protein